MYIKSARRLLWHHFLSLKYPRHDPGVWWLSILGGDYDCGAYCRSGAGPGFRYVLLIKILNSTKDKSTLSFCRKSP